MSSLNHKDIHSIAIFRALQLGDMLCSVPALRSIRAAFPQATITLIILPWAETFAKRYASYIDTFLSFPGYPGLPEQSFDSKAFVPFLKKIQEKQFDLVFQLHGKGLIANPLVSLFGAKHLTGFYPPEYGTQLCPDFQTFLPYPEHDHEIRRLLALLDFLGIKTQGEDLEFPLFVQDYRNYALLEKAYGLQPDNYICIHPGSVSGERWSEQHFAAVADYLAIQGWQIVLTGTQKEQRIMQKVLRHMHSPAINLAGNTDLGTLGVLLKNAALLIANDTGVVHLASAFQTPTVVLFQNSDPKRWAPLDSKLHKVVLSKGRSLETVQEEIEKLLFSSLRAMKERSNLNEIEIASSSTNVVSSQ